MFYNITIGSKMPPLIYLQQVHEYIQKVARLMSASSSVTLRVHLHTLPDRSPLRPSLRTLAPLTKYGQLCRPIRLLLFFQKQEDSKNT